MMLCPMCSLTCRHNFVDFRADCTEATVSRSFLWTFVPFLPGVLAELAVYVQDLLLELLFESVRQPLGVRPQCRDILSEDDDPPGVLQPVEQQGEEPEYAAVGVAHVSIIFVALLNSCLEEKSESSIPLHARGRQL